MKNTTLKIAFLLSVTIMICSTIILCQTNTTGVANADLAQNLPLVQVSDKSDLNESLKTIAVQEKYSFWNSFISGFSIIFVAEVGDRTFILIMIYAVTNNYIKTFLISNFVLLLWNYISIMIGYNIPFLMNKDLVEWVGIFTFTLFGILMIKDGYYMESILVEDELLEEEENLVKEKRQQNLTKVNPSDSVEDLAFKKNKAGNIPNENNLKEAFISKNKNNNASEINFKETSDVEKQNYNSFNSNNKAKDDLDSNFFDSFWAFGFTLLTAELGDKSQIASIVIGATQNFYGVLIGTSLAHLLCTVIAMVFGKIFSKYVTTRQITIIGGLIFLIFAAFFLIGKF